MKKPFSTIAVVVFAVIALAHACRVVEGWEVVIAGRIIPVWVSGPAVLVFGGLAFMVWREARK